MSPDEGAPRLPGRGRELFVSDVMYERSLHGQRGWCIPVALTSYRSLPLSCIDRLEIEVDGLAIPQTEMRVLLNQSAYRTADFPTLHDVWWFILDTAEVWIPVELVQDAPSHHVRGTLVKVEPYISNGRWHITSVCTRELTVVPNDAWRTISA